VSENFKKYQIPCDSIWLDIEYTDDKRYFTWNKETFPEARKMLEKLRIDGRKLVTIIDPHSKVDESYWIYKEAKERRLNVMNKESETDYQSECWPKESNWLDFLNKNTREYVAGLYSGVPEGCKDPENYIWNEKDVMVWNDMNEPACFNQTESTISKSTLHNFIPDDEGEES
jgi:alpha 1,3-glucosidase